jgi:hypothetical protein
MLHRELARENQMLEWYIQNMVHHDWIACCTQAISNNP